MNVAIFPYWGVEDTATGHLSRSVAKALGPISNITMFCGGYSPAPQIRWVKVPVLGRPSFVLFVSYHLSAPILYAVERVRRGSSFSHAITIDCNFAFADVCYAHFCERAYVRRCWKQVRPKGIRTLTHWLYHGLRCLMEPIVYRRADKIVVPSQGLAREIIAEYPFVSKKMHVIPNPIDAEGLRLGEDFDRNEFRTRLGFRPEDLVLSFVAVGDFDRKGLPLLMQAMSQTQRSQLKLIVVGGSSTIINEYRSKFDEAGLGNQVAFVGSQRDVRPYLWAADAFAFPSFYETFSLVTFEAAAAGLPLLVTSLYGVEEFLSDGENGILLKRTPEGVAEGIRKFLALSPGERLAMGHRAQRDVQCYSFENFNAAWRSFFEKLDAHGRLESVAPKRGRTASFKETLK